MTPKQALKFLIKEHVKQLLEIENNLSDRDRDIMGKQDRGEDFTRNYFPTGTKGQEDDGFDKRVAAGRAAKAERARVEAAMTPEERRAREDEENRWRDQDSGGRIR